MTAVKTVHPVSDCIVPANLPVLGAVTTTAPSNPETSLAEVLQLFTHPDAAERIAVEIARGESVPYIAQIFEIPAATITAYTEARAALLSAGLPTDILTAFADARAALLQADADAQNRNK